MSDEAVTIDQVHQVVAAFSRSFDAALVSAADAQRVVARAAAAEHMLAGVKSMAAARVAETELWKSEGDRSAAHQLARRTGTTVSKAREALDTAGARGRLPELDAAVRRGEVSPGQAGVIADAASKAPSAERRLLDTARRASFGELMDECARTKAAAEPDDEARYNAVHARRFLRRRRCGDGAAELQYRSTPDEVAEVFSVVRGFAERVFTAARAEGRREPEEAYLADGLVAAARAATASGEGAKPAPKAAKVVVRIDWDALMRGWPVGDEVSEIAGIGPVPVSAVRSMVGSGDAFLAAVVTKGVDVATVGHLGRRATAYQLTALQWRNPGCTVEGCNATAHLDVDHRIDWADTRFTLLALLDHLCKHHHHRKTYDGWALVEGAGKRPMVPPDDPRHPANAGKGAGPPERDADDEDDDRDDDGEDDRQEPLCG